MRMKKKAIIALPFSSFFKRVLQNFVEITKGEKTVEVAKCFHEGKRV